MQISAIFTNISNYNLSLNNVNSVPKQDVSYRAFASYDKNEKAEADIFELINEWKAFCHRQISENNTDFLA